LKIGYFFEGIEPGPMRNEELMPQRRLLLTFMRSVVAIPARRHQEEILFAGARPRGACCAATGRPWSGLIGAKKVPVGAGAKAGKMLRRFETAACAETFPQNI
jgi:hypothetical protein